MMGNNARSKLWVVIILVIVGICGVFVSAQSNRPKNVQTSLRAKWEGTPILLEAGELLSREWKDLFWAFIEGWLQHQDDDVDSHTAQGCVRKISNYGRSFLSEHLGSMFEFSLTLRSASPRLVLYRQLAQESLSSFPLTDDAVDGASELQGTAYMGNRKSDPLLVGVNPKSPGGNCCWVDTGASLFFDVVEMLAWLQNKNDVRGRDSFQQPELFEFDHVYSVSNGSSPVAILYGALGTDCFRVFHGALVEAAKKGKVTYAVRSVLPIGCAVKTSSCGALGSKDPVNLGGYGVELALKNMEYKAMDDSMIKKSITLEDPHTEDLSQEVRGFIFSKILERKPGLSSEIMAFRDYLLSSSISDTLEVWELKDLGHQTAQKIVHASNPLQAMQEINQNFPSVVASLSRMKLNDSVKDEILANQRMVPPGKSLMALNSALINIEDIDLYLLIDLVHQELSLADQFSKLKIPEPTIRKLLSTLLPSESSTFRVDFRSSHVHFINNLEKDSLYKRWRSNINEILMPTFPGQLRYIRKNLFHAVYAIDPATSCGREVIDMIANLYENQFPMRFGIILYSTAYVDNVEKNGWENFANVKSADEDISMMIIRLFLYIKENHGMLTAFKFLSNVHLESGDEDPEKYQVEGAFTDSVLSKSKSPPQDVLMELDKEKDFQDVAQDSSMFIFKLGLSKRKCCLLLNGLVYNSDEETLLNAMNDELPRIQEQVYYGNIDSRTDVLDKFLSESGVKRYNPLIITDAKVKPKFVSLSQSVLDEESALHEISYLHSPETFDDLKPVTHLLAIDLTSIKGMKLLREGIQYLEDGSTMARMGVLFVPSFASDSPGLFFAKIFQVTMTSYSHKKGVLKFLEQLCSLYENSFMKNSTQQTDSMKAFIEKVSDLADVNELPSKEYRSLLTAFSVNDLKMQLNKVALFLHKHLGDESSLNAVITNGRVTALPEESILLSHDLHLLEAFEFKHRIRHISEVIQDLKWENVDPDSLRSKFISDVIMLVSSSMATRDRSTEGARFEILQASYSAVVLTGESPIQIDAVIDPLSPSGQKIASLLQIFRKYFQPSMRIVLNPLSSLVDLPLKNYYRYVVPSMDDFSGSDYALNGPKAFFANMPLSKTLTMNLDVPETWLVEPVIAIHDLDNMLLENLGDTRTLQAVFELEALVLTGHCFEKDHDPPRGLQMILGTKTAPHLVDTLVMANLGYWQMKVSPGIWYLLLAPGRSSELYLLKEDDGQKTTLSKRIIINDLRGKVVHLEVVKKKGKEHEKLLVSAADEDQSSAGTKGSEISWNKNLFKWASGLIGGSQHTKKTDSTVLESKSDRYGKSINIFSVASGHLYERFLKIMILSVLKNTHRPVKFWFIKNYLSPKFKDVLPLMAREYGFDYELITYKWPTWLHKQTEKQRIIWAYKILFLDVIFPLSLDKVIFVDADQVVRTDLGELYDMDIKGRPLAYTPFCDNNKDMDGYRFWRQGFWKEHLRGKPYHISALYVVDLAKFRQTAAGDTLRVVYETLSKDPNSLSNLDQDLPNYAQHTVPIFSLPQEWLWCESWCGNSTKSKAKTIDLCNNPMTKEPKLQGAKRIVSEWTDLDQEARQFTAKILGEETDAVESTLTPPPQSESLKNDEVSTETDMESKAEL